MVRNTRKIVEIAQCACLGFALISCASTVVNVTSIPDGADVSIVTNSGEPKNIGKTPFILDFSQHSLQSEKSIQILVSKESFFHHSILLPKTLSPATHDLLVRLTEVPKPTNELGSPDSCPKVDYEITPRVARAVAEVQSFIAQRNFEGAVLKLTTMISQYPNIGILYDLLGNVYFLQRNLSESLRAYEKSLLIDPNNVEASRMIRRVKELMGLPASGG
jgi:hypothetical protein